MRLLLATHNEHKRREISRLLPSAEIEMLPDWVTLPPEVGVTFEANALGKARAAAGACDQIAIADDSGIGALQLGGEPGVRSARYAGEQASDEENLEKLMREVTPGGTLEYVCALVYVDPLRDLQKSFEGRCAGRMASSMRGERGFGYDPAFIPDDGPGELTMAELTDEQKDEISHRGRAARAMQMWLEQGASED